MSLGRQIGAVLLFTAVTSALVYVVTLLIPRVYASEQVLLFPSSQASGASIVQQLIPGGGGSSGDTTSVPSVPGGISTPTIGSGTQVATGILESRSCRTYVVRKLDLARRWRLNESRAVEEMRRRSKIRTDENGLLVIGAEAETPELAKDMSKALYDYLSSGAVELTRNLSKRNRVALEGRVLAYEKKVDQSQDRLINSALSHPYIEPQYVRDLLGDAIKKRGDAMASAAAAEARIENSKRLVAAAVRSGGDINRLQAIGGPSLTTGLETLADELEKRRADLEEASRLYTKRSPEYKTAYAKVEAIQRRIDTRAQEAAGSLKQGSFAPLIVAEAELAGLKRTLRTYDAILEEYKRMALKAPQDATTVKRAQAEFDTAIKGLEALRFQLEQAYVAEDRDPARFEVVDEAVANPEPVSPRKGLITGAWACACLAVGAWWILRSRVRFVD